MTVENNHCLEKITKGVQNMNVTLKSVQLQEFSKI